MKYLPLTLILFIFSSAQAVTEVANSDQLRAHFGLTSYPQGKSLTSLKVAILDNGFLGYQPNTGLLPSSTQLIDGPVNPEAQTAHGLGMAQIVWALTGKNAAGPQFYLVNTNGFSDFKSAIDYVITQKIDIVLYSQVWTFGDNFDGQGFINAQVNRATSAGIVWINAAGNFGGLVYNGPIDASGADHLLSFQNGKNNLAFENKLDSNSVTLTLSWNDFQDVETYNAVKDLDLFVYDSAGNLVGSSQLVQKGQAPSDDRASAQFSSYARETVTLANLNRGKYQIKISDQSHNFGANDKLRVAISIDDPASLDFTDHTTGSEIMPPADNATVFTVGEDTPFSSVGPTQDGRSKPDTIIDDSTISFTSGVTTRGSSNAAAIMTAIALEMKAANPAVDFAYLSSYATALQSPVTTDESDLSSIDTSLINPLILALLPADGQIMIETNGHLVILTSSDPLTLPVFQNVHAYRFHPDDILTVNVLANSWHVFPKASEALILAPWVEFRQVVTGQKTWRTP